jgi:hypothetical protein
MLFPAFAGITEISLKIAVEVAEYTIAQGYADTSELADLTKDANIID